MTDLTDFLTHFTADQAPDNVRHQARRCLADTLGVGFGGRQTRLSKIIRDHAAEIYPGLQPMAYDGRGVNPAGQALALGMTIDALDGHDGFNPAKGHVGAGLIAGLLALGAGHDVTAEKFEAALIAGYEAGSRLATTLHSTVPDYHTSGAWIAVAIAGAGAAMLDLPPDQVRHAMGIAEYHGPRSQMMRCIDHPTMVKDGSGWGAMAGVSAVLLAAKGFTGAPALTIVGNDWIDLGSRWLILEQYFKPYPVCRWAQAPVEAVLKLRKEHGLTSEEVDWLEVISFHEATRLATFDPKTTEEAQYSTAYPAAVALVHGKIGPEDLDEDALNQAEVKRIAASLTMREDDEANANFPSSRLARVAMGLKDGRKLETEWITPKWDANAPPSDTELRTKFVELVDGQLENEAGVMFDRFLNKAMQNPKTILTSLQSA